MNNMQIAVASLATDFTLHGSDGQSHSLSKYKGKRVILFFYPKDNTPW